ncbi:ABC transporter permease [Cellulomonas sp. URHD0024]|uniref:ABC transporter permease n=1 Tax=Cellulomonas sp. URHD0024 TaxID=1302620 RepID=UPI000412678A|nr:ABC transporter permease [Cellulomonas sp. URHD0024]
MRIAGEVSDVVASRELLGNLVQRDLRSRYRGTVLGWLWSLINPLATTLIFTVVFSVIMKVQPTTGADGLVSYPLFLLCALLPWNFFSTVVQGGQSILLNNANLIKKTYFPRRLLLLAHVGSSFVTFLIEMAVLLVIFAFFGVNTLPWIPLLLVFMVLVALFGLGIALALSVWNVYFRDVAHFVALFMQIWFYATPIIYPITLVSSVEGGSSWASGLPLTTLYELNPLVSFFEPIRDMLYGGTFPEWHMIGLAVLATAVSLLLGNLAFRRLEPRLAEEL